MRGRWSATFIPHRPADGTALAWRFDATTPPAGDERAHFLVPPATSGTTSSHAATSCSSAATGIDQWLADHGHDEGYRFDLETLWRFAAHWYDGRLEAGYRRREPAEAADYFRRSASMAASGPA